MTPELLQQYLRIVKQEQVSNIHVKTPEWEITITGIFVDQSSNEEREDGEEDPLEGLRRG